MSKKNPIDHVSVGMSFSSIWRSDKSLQGPPKKCEWPSFIYWFQMKGIKGIKGMNFWKHYSSNLSMAHIKPNLSPVISSLTNVTAPRAHKVSIITAKGGAHRPIPCIVHVWNHLGICLIESILMRNEILSIIFEGVGFIHRKTQ